VTASHDAAKSPPPLRFVAGELYLAAKIVGAGEHPDKIKKAIREDGF